MKSSPLFDGLRHQLIELFFNPGGEIRFHAVDFGELGEGPAAVLPQVIDARYPIGVHRGLLFLGVLPPVAFDFDDQVQRFLRSVLQQDNKIGKIDPLFGAEAIRHLHAQVVVLDVGPDAGVRFRHAAELRFPVAVKDHPVDVASPGVRFPAVLPGSGEVDVHRRTDGIVGVGNGFG